jgi:hypothetical protein
MEQKNSSATKIIIAFVLGFVFGFAVSQTFLSERPAAGGDAEGERAGEASDEATGGLQEGGEAGFDFSSGSGADVDVLGEFGSGATVGERVSGSSAIAIESQTAGLVALVKHLVLDERSWIAIHEDERGRPGRILGAARFAAGTHTDVSVELIRPTESGGVYYGMIHRDDGDDSFDSKTDLHLADESGSPIMVRFSAI